MTIDIRADVYCSLGPVISGSFSDDYIQDSGLIKTRGEVTLNGLHRPAAGTVVEFGYVRNGVGSRLPRKLRVLAVFADPYRNTTSVTLGCKLSYLEGRKPPVKNPTSVDENGTTPPGVIAIASLPISAAYVFEQCLLEIGLEASSNPLTNKFSTEEFSMDSGYIAVISDLLKSEGYFGYVDEREILVISSINETAGAGPLIDVDSLIDISPIDVGELPGDSVVVNYSYLRLEPPKETDGGASGDGTEYERNYTIEKTTGSEQELVFNVAYTDAFGAEVEREITRKYSPCSETIQTYSLLKFKEKDSGLEKEKWVVTEKVQTSNGHYLDAAAGFNTAMALYYNGAFVPWFDGVYEKRSVSTYFYDPEGNVIKEKTEEKVPRITVLAAAPVPWTDYFNVTDFVGLVSFTGPEITASETVTTFAYNEELDMTTSTTMNYKSKTATSEGQNDFGRRLERARLAGDDRFIAECNWVILEAPQLVFDSSSVNISIGRGTFSRDVAGGGSPGDGPLVQEDTAGIEWIDGSVDSQLVTQFSVPYSGDDYLKDVSGSGETLEYTIVRSDAPVKARNYGSIQNRLLLGNRSGLSIQISADNMPARPFAPIYIEASGYIGQYRTNGTSYTFDSNGIVASTDAMFWGGVGES